MTYSLEMPTFDVEDLISHIFLMDPEEDGQCFHTCIIQAIEDYESDFGKCKDHVKFVCSVNDGKHEKPLTNNKLIDSLASEEDGEDIFWKFQQIVSHQGPLQHIDQDYNGSLYNVMIKWENGEITSEPLSVIVKDDPITCAIYAHDNNLLDTNGWKCFKSIAKHEQKYKCLIHQVKHVLIDLHCVTSMGMRYHKTTHMHSSWTPKQATIFGGMQPHLRWINLWSTTHLPTWAMMHLLHLVVKRSAHTWCSMSNTMDITKHG